MKLFLVVVPLVLLLHTVSTVDDASIPSKCEDVLLKSHCDYLRVITELVGIKISVEDVKTFFQEVGKTTKEWKELVRWFWNPELNESSDQSAYAYDDPAIPSKCEDVLSQTQCDYLRVITEQVGVKISDETIRKFFQEVGKTTKECKELVRWFSPNPDTYLFSADKTSDLDIFEHHMLFPFRKACLKVMPHITCHMIHIVLHGSSIALEKVMLVMGHLIKSGVTKITVLFKKIMAYILKNGLGRDETTLALEKRGVNDPLHAKLKKTMQDLQSYVKHIPKMAEILLARWNIKMKALVAAGNLKGEALQKKLHEIIVKWKKDDSVAVVHQAYFVMVKDLQKMLSDVRNVMTKLVEKSKKKLKGVKEEVKKISEDLNDTYGPSHFEVTLDAMTEDVFDEIMKDTEVATSKVIDDFVLPSDI